MSTSNCCFWPAYRFLRRQVWYSHLLKNFPQFVAIHTVNGFGVVNKAEVDFFLFFGSLAFSMIQQMLAIWSLIHLPFLNPAWISLWKFTVHVLLKAGLENIEHYFASVWDECNCVVVGTFFDIAFLWDWNENRPFPVLWSLLSVPHLLAYWVSTFTASSFRIWNSSTGILSPPPVLLVVMLPKAHLTSHSRMSGSSECSDHCSYLGHEDLFCTVLLCILATSS